MSKTARFAVSLDENLLEDFDKNIEERGYETRSEAIRDLIRDFLITQDWNQKEEVIGTITLVYDHHQNALPQKLLEKQHQQHNLVVSSLHVHLDYHNCLEILAVKGLGRDIQHLADALISIKGVKHGKLTLTDARK